MATPPKCKLCGSAHWGTDHVFATAPKTVPRGGSSVRPPAPKVVEVRMVADPKDLRIAELEARVAELEAVAAVTRQRREANRLRMAKARAS